MIGKVAVILLSALCISSTPHATIQRESSPAQGALRLAIDGDPVMAELMGIELKQAAAARGRSLSVADKDATSYDRRIILTSGAGRQSGTCSSTCSTNSTDVSVTCSSSSCNVSLTMYFVGAAVLTPEGKLQDTDVAEGDSWKDARKQLARKLILRL